MPKQPQLFSKGLEAFVNASAIGQDRITRKEVQLGTIRQMPVPQDHMGLANFAPWLEVAADDVIFDYIVGDVDGLVPARAEDAESELAQKDDMVLGQGRASIVDWAVKDHYDPSDVNRYREYLKVMEALRNGELPLTITSALTDWATKYARDTARRTRKIQNRINWLIMNAVADNVITYNDGKIKFTVTYDRPAAQSAGNAANTIAGAVAGVWDTTAANFDPVGFIENVKTYMDDTYGIKIDRALTTKRVLRRFVMSDKWSQLAGLGAAYSAAGAARAPDPNYLISGWGPDAAIANVSAATGVDFLVDDSVYRTRAIGGTTITNNRFFPQDRIVFLPSDESINLVDDTDIGFGKTLTSPHPEGDWTPGFYEWERSTVDPWGQDAGTGCKAFPVFPHMEYTVAFNVDTTP